MCHAQIQDGDHFFKMADMSGKEIIKFANKCAYLSNWDDHGVKSYSLEHVENEFEHLELLYPEVSFCHNLSREIKIA